jgi:hypothetical protein
MRSFLFVLFVKNVVLIGKQNMPCTVYGCSNFQVDNKALSLTLYIILQVGLRTGSNAVSASRANSFL